MSGTYVQRYLILLLIVIAGISLTITSSSSCFVCEKDGCQTDPCNSKYFYQCNLNNSTKTLRKCKKGYFYESDNKCGCREGPKPESPTPDDPCPRPLKGRKLIADNCDCSTYWICCSEQGIVKQSCKIGQVFDPATKKCVARPKEGPLATCCGNSDTPVDRIHSRVSTGCPCKKGACHCPADSECNTFFSCCGGSVLTATCYPNSLGFDPNKNDCVKKSDDLKSSCSSWIEQNGIPS